jgi:hypothetical protein
VNSLGRAVRVVATIGSAWACTACGAYSVTATGGATFQQTGTAPDPMGPALRASAARDLPCESADVDVRRLDAERQYAVTGCGRRAFYRALTPTLHGKRLELVSSSTLLAGDMAFLTKNPPSGGPPAR